MKKLIIAAILATVVALLLGACSGEDSAGLASDSTHHTAAQEKVIQAAENYVGMGTGISRSVLIEQLTSKSGDGFKRRNAVFAVNHIEVNWDKQAVLSAKSYLASGIGFTRRSLIRQLTSKTGERYTRAQAEYAADKLKY